MFMCIVMSGALVYILFTPVAVEDLGIFDDELNVFVFVKLWFCGFSKFALVQDLRARKTCLREDMIRKRNCY